MERLFVIDAADYDESWPRSVRPTVRAIVECGDRLGMIYKVKGNYYAFPGGGIDEGETYHEALIREVEEETGLRVIPESIRDFGSALRLNSSHRYENTIFEQENYYYTCEAYEELAAQNLESEEAEEGFELRFVTPEEALRKNREEDHAGDDGIWLERESRILEIIIARKNG